MDKQKQIEEMEQYLVQSIVCSKSWKPRDIIEHLTKMIIPESAVVLTQDEWDKIGIRLVQARKETAEKFAERIKARYMPPINKWDEISIGCLFYDIDEICNEISEGK